MRIKIIEREVLNPLAEVDNIKMELTTLPEKIGTISLLDNTKPHADLILELISETLDFDKIIKIKKPAGAPATEEQIKKAALADLTILALGDCGSCTTWLILDAIKLEKQKTPTIIVSSDVFAPFARELAESYGVSNLRIVKVKHPIAGQPEEEIVNKTPQVITQIEKLLKP